MAEDNSVIVVPPILTVTTTQKFDTSLVGQEVNFNNGIFVNKSSLTAILPKSLYKVYKKNNKIYLFERETTRIEKVIDDISKNLNVFAVSNTSDGILVDVKLTDSSIAATKTNNSFLLNGVYSTFNNSSDTILNATKTHNPYTKFSTVNNFNLYINKSLNIYTLKTSISAPYLQFVKPPQTILNNFFIRIKSIFTSKEITSSYYNNFVYLLSNWCLFGIDELTTTDFDISKRANIVKSKLSSPLKETDLQLLNSINIIDAKQIINNSSNVVLFQNVLVSNTSEETTPTSTITILQQDGGFIINNENYNNFINKILVFVNKQTNDITSIKIKNLYDVVFRVRNVSDVNKSAFTYDLITNFDSTGPALKTEDWNRNQIARKSTETSVLYDVYIYDESNYIGFHFYNNSVLELEIDNTSFRTNSEGDFYVVEIN